jgi:hypothetical protein
VGEAYCLQLELPHAVRVEPLECAFELERCVLLLSLAVLGQTDAAAATDDSAALALAAKANGEAWEAQLSSRRRARARPSSCCRPDAETRRSTGRRPRRRPTPPWVRAAADDTHRQQPLLCFRWALAVLVPVEPFWVNAARTKYEHAVRVHYQHHEVRPAARAARARPPVNRAALRCGGVARASSGRAVCRGGPDRRASSARHAHRIRPRAPPEQEHLITRVSADHVDGDDGDDSESDGDGDDV